MYKILFLVAWDWGPGTAPVGLLFMESLRLMQVCGSQAACQTVSPVNAAVTGGCASGDFLLQRFAQDGQKEHESGPQTDKVREIYT